MWPYYVYSHFLCRYWYFDIKGSRSYLESCYICSPSKDTKRHCMIKFRMKRERREQDQRDFISYRSLYVAYQCRRAVLHNFPVSTIFKSRSVSVNRFKFCFDLWLPYGLSRLLHLLNSHVKAYIHTETIIWSVSSFVRCYFVI